jgi:hypothetical protein
MSLPVLKLPKRVYPRAPKALPLLKQYPLYALSFDGVDDYVAVPHSSSLNVQAFTIIIWLLPRAWTYTGLIMKSPTNYVRDFNFGIWLNLYANVNYGHGDGTNYLWRTAPANILSLNAWNCIALTFDGSTYILYVNGVQKDTATTTITPITNTAPIYMMANATLTGFTNGLLGGVCLYNRALSASEIQWNYRNPLNPARSGLVLWLPMVEGSGASVRDFSGYGNNGTLYNGVAWRELAKYELQTT